MNYIKTAAGQQALRDRSVPMTARQRSAFVLFDGKRSMADVLAASGAQMAEVEQLVQLGLLAPVDGAVAPPAAAAGTGAAPVVAAPGGVAAPAAPAPAVPAAAAVPRRNISDQDRYMLAYPIATRLTSSLGLRGFRLNLAVEAVGGLDQLRELAPRIRDAVGVAAFEPLRAALED